MYSNKDVIEYVNSFYTGIKRIAALFCVKICTPLIRILHQEFSLIHNDAENLNHQLTKCIENEKHIENYCTDYLSSRLDKFEERLEKMESTVDMYGVKLARMMKNDTFAQDGRARQNGEEIHAARKADEQNYYHGIDYFDFENHFRGSRAHVKRGQEMYIQYFKNREHVIDFGCGRGEFLELLKENGVHAYGVELYQEFVDLCMEKHLNVVYGDAVKILEQETVTDGIFAGQLIEHLELEKLIYFIELAYEKLLPGAYFILETPNPMSLAIYTHSFYIDPSHNKPVHPLTIEYLLEKAGFRDIQIVFTENSRLPVTIPELVAENVENLASFNEAMREVEKTLFGSQDYAVIARK